MIDKFGIAKFKGHQHCNANHLGLDLRIAISLDQRAKRIGPRFQVRPLASQFRLRQQQVGIESNGSKLIRSSGQDAACFEQRAAICDGIVQAD